jgi:uncharacterized RmlC-like cupin family protein
VTVRRGRRRKKLLDDLKEIRGYCHLKKKDLARTMWRKRCGIDFGPVVRQTTKRISVLYTTYICIYIGTHTRAHTHTHTHTHIYIYIYI